MLGIPKPKEGLGTTIAGGTSVVKTRHGRMHCKVGVPISARARAEGKVQRELGTLTPGEGKPYDAAGKKFILDLGYEVRTDFSTALYCIVLYCFVLFQTLTPPLFCFDGLVELNLDEI